MTAPQARLVAYIRDYQADNQRPPTVREMMEHMGFKSPRSVSYQLDHLVAQGVLIRRGGGNARNIFLAPSATEPLSGNSAGSTESTNVPINH